MFTYTEMKKRDTFLARFHYLMLGGELGVSTFGFDRYLNQSFYASPQWKSVRDVVIIRDQGRDLGVPGYEIHDRILVHHMNPIQVRDITEFNPEILDPEFLICVTTPTHNAIHFGDEKQLPSPIIERRPGDTTLW